MTIEKAYQYAKLIEKDEDVVQDAFEYIIKKKKSIANRTYIYNCIKFFKKNKYRKENQQKRIVEKIISSSYYSYGQGLS